MPVLSSPPFSSSSSSSSNCCCVSPLISNSSCDHSSSLQSSYQNKRDVKKAREAFFQNDIEASKAAHNKNSYFESEKNVNKKNNKVYVDKKLNRNNDVYSKLEEGVVRVANQNLIEEENHDEIHNLTSGDYFKAFIFGGLDGIVTIFAIVAGCVGANLSILNIITIGIGNLFADAVSMGFGEYVSAKAEDDFVDAEKRREEWEVENCPEEEKGEMIEIYTNRYGFSKHDAQQMVDISFKYKVFFIQHMMVEELGLMTNGDGPTPMRRGLVMFVSFSVFGLVPLACFIGWAVFFGLAPHSLPYVSSSSSAPPLPSTIYKNTTSILSNFSYTSSFDTDIYNSSLSYLQDPSTSSFPHIFSYDHIATAEEEENARRHTAFFIACVFSILTLFILGVFKGRFVGQNSILSGCLMALNGSFAGTVAYVVGSLLQKTVI